MQAVAQLQGFALRLLEQLIEPALFQIPTALHETAQAAREMLHHRVHLATALQQRAGQPAQEGAFAAIELAGKPTGKQRIQRLVELAALLGVVEQAPERLEGAPGFAVCNHVHAVEQLFEHVAARAFVVDDALAELAVELLEVVAHAMEIFGQLVGEMDQVACTFQRALAVQRRHAAGGHAFDLGIDARTFVAQRGQPELWIGFGLSGQLHQLLDHQRQAAFGGAAAAFAQADDEADGLGRGTREFVFFFGCAFRQAAFQPALCQPMRKIRLCGARQFTRELVGAQGVELALQTRVQHRRRQAAFAIHQHRLQQADQFGCVVGGKQFPYRLLAQLPIAGDTGLVLHGRCRDCLNACRPLR